VKLLAIETATEACSAALLVDGEISQRYEIAPREHARRILVMVDELLADAQIKPAQLDGIAFGRGPGSFMGVRIAASVTQGIAYALDLPVVPVSTLAAIAQESGFTHTVAAIDARMDEIYFGVFERADSNQTVQPVGEERLLKPENVSLIDSENQTWHGVGTGWQAYSEVMGSRLPQVIPSEQYLYPTAKAVAQLAVDMLVAGNTVTAEHAVPVYLRDKVAEKPA